MKVVPILILLVGLLSCRPDDVNPEAVTQLVYGQSGGFAGVSYKLTLNDTQQRFQSYQCEKVISYTDWRTLLADFNATDYKRLPEKAEPECCDMFAYSLDITTGKKTYHREWGSFAFGSGERLPQSIGQLSAKLSDRAWTEAQACQ
ncbi:hypothetical protein [Spirosoma sp. KUDC1026]|uniref:hypothetical protein n=1 Tax=Spirosoma sp. KUDC1026 TaxID=2745947 RepID=UPI00159B86F0|nr:hypothetical protein [Spirosoma sp. KUDC1026]QKZ12150.1 hypothetical protein HU175_05710 [Spirosoma sp. KUDC1026]